MFLRKIFETFYSPYPSVIQSFSIFYSAPASLDLGLQRYPLSAGFQILYKVILIQILNCLIVWKKNF